MQRSERELATAIRRADEASAGRDRAEADGWQNAQLLSLLIQGVTDYAIFMLDRNGRVSTWNSGAERIKGYTAAEIIGAPYARFYEPEDVAAGEPERALATAARDGRYEAEGWRVRKDGGRFWAHIVLHAIHDAAGTLVGYAKVTRDITDRRQAQLELQAAREALFQAQKMEAVGQLTAGIAHDFNNMLAGIIGALDLLRTRLRSGRTDDAVRYADMAIAAAERAAALTARLLAFGRRQPLDIKSVDLNGVLASMQDLLARTMGEGVRVDMACAAGLPAAQTDPHQLENALLNLAINARDAMAGRGTLTLSTGRADPPAGAAGSSEGSFVMLEVADTGCGMSAEVMAKALDPFFTTKPAGQGTGLGLSMVYGFARQSRGHLEIASSVGEGTRIHLFLPATDVPVQAEPAPAADPSRPAPLASRVVLVVEDDDHVRELALDVLRELGITARAAADGPSALGLLRAAGTIDLMLCDIGLAGGMDGRQLADAARALRPELPVLFMTGYAADTAGGDSFGPGTDLIQKPFSVDALSRRLRALLDPSGGAGAE
ncbi:MAG: hypothetical protein B7X99_04865 [Rhizobiales bacterium 17-65-6]|nr:MAG: hypothetical protein B7X99_04865 [Rhizobiales bacterium 17-65-6]